MFLWALIGEIGAPLCSPPPFPSLLNGSLRCDGKSDDSVPPLPPPPSRCLPGVIQPVMGGWGAGKGKKKKEESVFGAF